jgi:hypothetical protein
MDVQYTEVSSSARKAVWGAGPLTSGRGCPPPLLAVTMTPISLPQ